MDILNLAKASGIDAERTATELFGLAVQDFAATPLNAALEGAFGKSADEPVNRNDGSWYSTSYAASLANSQFRPKLKFLFRVEFLFKPQILEQHGAQSANWKKNFTFLIKKVDRPKIDFEYEEVNMYNFRTKILKSIKHKDVNISFADDVGNNVHEFFKFMMMVHSPITRRSVGSSQEIANASATYESGNGMLFSDNFGNTNDYAHRGVMNSDVGNAIQAIKVTQLFMQPGSGQHDLDVGAKEVSFFFVNPRIVSFEFDEMSSAASEASELNMSFDYDFMVMSDMQTLQTLAPEKSLPPVGTAPGEANPTGRAQSGQSPIGNNDPYTSILAGIGARAVQRITSETIGRQIRRIPGLGSVADTLGGLVQGITRDRITDLGNSVNQSFARPGRDVVTDNTIAGHATSEYTTAPGGFGTDQPAPTGSTDN